MPAGRPPMYKTPEELQKKVDEYFNGGMNTKKVLIGKPPDQRIEEIPIPTITGLALFLGFCDRSSFYNYEDNPEFSYTIKKARTFIEIEYEQILHTGNVAGAIFALKNMGWKDKTESEVTLHTEQPLFPDVHKNESNK